VTKVG